MKLVGRITPGIEACDDCLDSHGESDRSMPEADHDTTIVGVARRGVDAVWQIH